jgi:hypothetical protein
MALIAEPPSQAMVRIVEQFLFLRHDCEWMCVDRNESWPAWSRDLIDGLILLGRGCGLALPQLMAASASELEHWDDKSSDRVQNVQTSNGWPNICSICSVVELACCYLVAPNHAVATTRHVPGPLVHLLGDDEENYGSRPPKGTSLGRTRHTIFCPRPLN